MDILKFLKDISTVSNMLNKVPDEPQILRDPELHPIEEEPISPIEEQPISSLPSPQILPKPTVQPSVSPQPTNIEPTTPPMPELDINAYEKAAEEYERRLHELAKKEAMLNISKGIAGAFGQVNPASLSFLQISDIEKNIAELPLKKLSIADKGREVRLELQEKQEKSDPNSEMSKIYRDNFTELADKVGLNALANSLKNSKLSASQIEDMVGQLNLQNLFTTKLAADSRLESLMLKMAGQQEKEQQKADKEKIRMEENLRKSINNRQDLSLSREVVKQARSLQMSVDEIVDDLQAGRKVDVYGKSAAALFEAMKIIQQDKSVVREGEYKNILGAFGTLENFERQIRQDLLKQGALTPNMIRALNELSKLYRKKHEQFIYEKIKPDFYKTEKHGLDKDVIFDQDLQEIYNKRRMMEELKNKKIEFKDGKFIVKE
ncbi:MAG: hypothetical protein RML94_01760 [Bacteroidia bacterium]|nr:hypothetical protein [Bacteroidia bacterium]